MLTDTSMNDDTLTRRAQLGDSPTLGSLAELVSQNIPLNTKQMLIVRKLLANLLTWADYLYDSSRRNKTQIPKAIEAALHILGRKHEIILTAPTGAAAENLGGNSYYTSLGINLSYKASVTARARKTILVIDEMSVVDLKMLSVINNQCKVARSLPRSSPDLFGGLPIVILMGDFF
ncbi:uncharacterized protein N7498_008930 [Penicillium cinerascens]|uniref:Uncharacterized protein n=1 Tax=Penicillium cinerascens TaxID=70096 RepID=A0A9W9JGE5_9EURO|nr:uncharacterized protein N7498_008930 [Penicillium cinerascens]KAJ5195492.1 hypothetical protein N7498_008930 [Penicillium cinerascens]